MSSYQSTRPRFPNPCSAPPWQPHTGAHPLSRGLHCWDVSHFSQLAPAPPAPSGDGAASAGSSSTGLSSTPTAPTDTSPTGTAAPPPPRRTHAREGALRKDAPDEIDPARAYRRGPVYSSAVPTAVVRALGLTTHMGTLRLETAALGLMSYLGQVSEQHHALREQQFQERELQEQQLQEQPKPNSQQLPLFWAGDGAPPRAEDVPDKNLPEAEHLPPSRYQYVNAYSGREHIVERRPGTVVKSIQGIAEDLYQRVYKRLPPRQDPLEDPAFRRV